MPTVTESLAQALQFHRAGDVQRAEQIYRRIIQAAPGHPDAWFYLGVACLGTNRHEEAVLHYQQSLRLQPNNPAAHSDLGVALANLGRTEEAIASFQQALQWQPNHVDACNNLGVALGQLNRHEEAVACYQYSLQINPHHAGAYNNLGLSLQHLSRWEEAETCLRRAIELKPDYADAYYNLGLTYARQGKWEEAAASYQQGLRIGPATAESLGNLGLALRNLGRLEDAALTYQQSLWLKPEYVEALSGLGLVFTELNRLNEAEVCLRKALRIRPDCAEALNNLGLTLMRQERYPEAIETLQESLRLNPNSVEAWNNLGLALGDQDRNEEAQKALETAIRLNPRAAEVYNNLGQLLTEQNRFDEALKCLEQALKIIPNYPEPHFTRSRIYLLRGDFERGWPEYEWRLWCKKFARRAFPQPMWDGSSPAGRTILLHAEQGLGDAIQFIRYAAIVKQMGARVIVECREPVMRLFATCSGIDQLVRRGAELPPFDFHAPLLSLPAILKTTMETIPAQVPYFQPDPARVEEWRQEIAGGGEQRTESPPLSRSGSLRCALRSVLKIGIAWQGNPEHKTDRHRSVSLAAFAPLARLEGVQLFSLQKGPGSEQLATLIEQVPALDLGSRFSDFMETAAALVNLDLVITVDTAVAHCAGALAVPVWVLQPTNPDWRWLLNREDSPWYPTMRLFRQREPKKWDDVFQRVVEELRRLCNGTASNESEL